MNFLRQAGRCLRVHNVAKLCGVSGRTVRSWAESGLLPGHKIGPKIWFFNEAALQGGLGGISVKIRTSNILDF